jgi:outer membrane receptor protein involved in Fe transport
VDASLTWRFIGKVGLDNNDPDPTLHFAKFKAYNFYNSQLPNISYFDLAASRDITKGITIRGGINNILDKDPPLATFEITAGGAANAYSAYDQLGRQLFVAFTAKF